MTRSFDPVLSAALRNELEHLADREAARPARPVLARPQVWISVVTALVLVAATVGVLRLTAPAPVPAKPAGGVVDPLSRITDPTSPYYVARSVTTLLDTAGRGSGTVAFDVPGSVREYQLYVNCSRGDVEAEVDGQGAMKGGCVRDSGTNYSQVITAGRHTVSVRVGADVQWALTIIERPGPTIAAGDPIDPLTAVRDLRNPDAIPGAASPLLQDRGDRTGEVRTVAVPEGVRRLRVLLVCSPSAPAVRVRIDGHQVLGCMNAIAHWYDFTPSSRSITAQVVSVSRVPWRLLVLPAPAGATDSPENALLPYPETAGPGAVLARAHGVGATATGTYRRPAVIAVTTTCRGRGWLEIRLGEGDGTSTRGTACSTTRPDRVGFGGEAGKSERRWTVIPHGDISWTFQISDDR